MARRRRLLRQTEPRRRGIVWWAARFVYLCIGLVVLALFAAGGTLWMTVPPNDQTLRIPGLSAPVEITLDGDGVPRIHAASAHDAYAALGFMHARDRMFQMDLTRRATAGRLSELAGPATLALDKHMRVLGLGRLAEDDAAVQSPEAKVALEAYADGVNAWIAARGRFAALEYLWFGPPEPWRPSDCLMWARGMGLLLSGNYRTELARLALKDKLPRAKIEDLWPTPPRPLAMDALLDQPAGGPLHAANDPPRETSARGQGASPTGAPPLQARADRPDAASPLPAQPAGGGQASQTALALLDAIPTFPAPFTQPNRASNAWAIDGRGTETGAPMLAGDPHLGLGFPGLWYLARIEMPGLVLAGATAPGVPFLVLGHNGRIAWTFSTNGADTQDVYIEPADAKVTAREERIRVKDGADVVLIVRRTRHGPVISDLDAGARTMLAVAMANLAPDSTAASGLLALNRAATVEDAGKAAPLIDAPVQNLLVADPAKIALFVTGRVPIRRAGDGWAPRPGRAEQLETAAEEPKFEGLPVTPVARVTGDDLYGWSGFARGEALPHAIAPPSGRLINANEPVAPPEFPVFMGRDTFRDWRAARIRALLSAHRTATMTSFAEIQTDTVSPFATSLLPALRAVPGAGPVLGAWDGTMREDRPEPLIFSAWMYAFEAAVLQRAADQAGVAVSALRAARSPLTDFVPYVVSPAGAHWCGGDCRGMLKASFDAAMASLAERYGADRAGWRWGTVHQAVFAHPLFRTIPALDRLTTARIEAPGDGATIGRGEMNAAMEAVHGPGYRGIYDLADLDRSLFVVAPGQSGNLVSPHAHDFLTRWRDGAMVLLTPKPVTISGRIHLTP